MLKIERIQKVYPGFSLDIGPLAVSSGQIVALVGPNGAGKTTLIRCILGIVHPDILKGAVRGTPFEPESPFARSIIGYVPEEPVLFESVTVGRLLRFVSGFYAEWDEDLARSLLDHFQLDGGKKVRALSKGMRTKVLLLMALARSARILFLDEPTSGLDPVSKEGFWAYIHGLFQQGRIQAAMVSSHQLEEIQQFCNRAIFLKSGRVIYDERNFSKEDLRDLFRDAAPTGRAPWL